MAQYRTKTDITFLDLVCLYKDDKNYQKYVNGFCKQHGLTDFKLALKCALVREVGEHYILENRKRFMVNNG